MPLLVRFFKDRARGHAFFALGLFSYAWMVAAFMPLIVKDTAAYQKLIEQYPRELLTVLAGNIGSLEAWFTPEGFVSLEFLALWFPVIMLGYVVGYGTALVAKEVENGTIENLLAIPVSRTRLLLERTLALVIGLAALTAFTFAGLYALSRAYGFELSAQGTLAAAIHVFGFVLVFAALTVLLSIVFLERGKPAAVTIGYFVLAHLVNALATNSETLKDIQFLSLFKYYDVYTALAEARLDVWNNALFFGLSAALFAAAVFIFRRRDILIA